MTWTVFALFWGTAGAGFRFQGHQIQRFHRSDYTKKTRVGQGFGAVFGVEAGVSRGNSFPVDETNEVTLLGRMKVSSKRAGVGGPLGDNGSQNLKGHQQPGKFCLPQLSFPLSVLWVPPPCSCALFSPLGSPPFSASPGFHTVPGLTTERLARLGPNYKSPRKGME